MIKNILTIAGTDPTGGAGIQTDLKTFAALGTYGCSVITAVVAQNTQGVRSVSPLAPALVADQLDAVFEDVRIDAVKIGMLASEGIVRVVARKLREYQAPNIVIDPVIASSSGHALLDIDAIEALKAELFPQATLITPNLPEAEILLGQKMDWTDATLRDALPRLQSLGPRWVLLKGGHLEDSRESTDLLLGPNGIETFAAPRLHVRGGHGTGCTLSSAIASGLALADVSQSVRHAKAFLHMALRDSDQLSVGRGKGPLHHMSQLWADQGR